MFFFLQILQNKNVKECALTLKVFVLHSDILLVYKVYLRIIMVKFLNLLVCFGFKIAFCNLKYCLKYLHSLFKVFLITKTKLCLRFKCICTN